MSERPGGRRARGAGSEPAPALRTVFTLSEEETFELGQRLGRELRGGELVLLEGDLGLGKTVFVRGVAVSLGIPPDDVSSPSFTLVHEYRGGRLTVFHVDLYRIDRVEELATLGLEEILDSSAVVLVEWGERLPPALRKGALIVRLHEVGEGSRRIELLGPEPPSR